MARHNKGISGEVSAQITVLRGEDDNGDDIELVVNVSGYFEAEQDGGWDDPSWPASVDLESFETEDGCSIDLTDSEKDEAREALWSVVRGD